METKIGTAILTELKKLFANSYFDRVPRGTTFPYAVFTTPSSFQLQDKTEIISLEIDVWDNKGNNITTLESTTKTIWTGLHKAVYIDNTMTLIFQRDSLLHIQEPDEQIRRRKITFSVKYYDREV